MGKRLLPTTSVINNGKYRIYRRLGSGTFGEVYEASVLPEERVFVAIKVSTAERYNAHALRELATLQALQSTGQGIVVGLLGSFRLRVEGEERVCMVLEKLDLSLYQILKTKKEGFALSEVAVLGRKLVEVLRYLKTQELLHLDLKPANVLVNLRDVQLRIADLGSASYITRPTDSVAQTAAYRAPEVALGLLPYSYAADMWSFGCILAELYCRFRVSGPEGPLHALVRCFGLLPREMFAEGHAECSFNELRLLSEHSQPSLYSQRLQEAHRLKIRDPSSDLFPLFQDLLARIFRYEPTQRLTVEEASSHPFFEAALRYSQTVNLGFEEPPWPAQLFPTKKGVGVTQRRPRRYSSQHVREMKRTAESTPPSSGSSRHESGSSMVSSDSTHTQD